MLSSVLLMRVKLVDLLLSSPSFDASLMTLGLLLLGDFYDLGARHRPRSQADPAESAGLLLETVPLSLPSSSAARFRYPFGSYPSWKPFCFECRGHSI